MKEKGRSGFVWPSLFYTMKEITAFKCDHCKKVYQRKHSCENHEETCLKNPLNYHPCLDHCTHLERKEIEYYTGIDDYFSGEPIYKKTKGFYCKILDKLMMHPNCNNDRGNLSYVDFNGVEEVEQKDMPKICETHESYLSKETLPWEVG